MNGAVVFALLLTSFQTPNLQICEFEFHAEVGNQSSPAFDADMFVDDLLLSVKELGIGDGDHAMQSEFRFIGANFSLNPSSTLLSISIAGPPAEGPEFALRFLNEFARDYRWDDYKFIVEDTPKACSWVYCAVPCNNMPLE